MDIAYDMETADPDDAMTLCFLAGHPQVNLRAVTVTPGSKHQVGLIKEILKRIGHEHVPVGRRAKGHDKPCVSSFHYRWLGQIEPATEDGLAADILVDVVNENFTLLTGAALTNPKDLLRSYPDVHIPIWVAQGGFAGDNVVPAKHILEKFRGKKTCATFNFNGDIEGAFELLKSNKIGKRYLVSKNVCHGVCYDKSMHETIKAVENKSPGLQLLFEGMETYLQKKPKGKLFHDPLAAAVAIDKSVCDFREVELYREKGQWGSELQQGTNTFISVSFNKEKFISILTNRRSYAI